MVNKKTKKTKKTKKSLKLRRKTIKRGGMENYDDDDDDYGYNAHQLTGEYLRPRPYDVVVPSRSIAEPLHPREIRSDTPLYPPKAHAERTKRRTTKRRRGLVHTDIEIEDESNKPLVIGSEEFTKEFVRDMIKNKANADSPESQVEAYIDANNYMTSHKSRKDFPNKIKKINGKLRKVYRDLNEVERELSQKPNNMVLAEMANERGQGQNSRIYTMGDNPDDETEDLFIEHGELLEKEEKLIDEIEKYNELMEKARKNIKEMEDQIKLVYLGGKSKRRTRKRGGDEEKSIVAEPDTIFEDGKLYDINSKKGDDNYALFINHRYNAKKTLEMGENPNVGENSEAWNSKPIWFTYEFEKMPGSVFRVFQRNEIAGINDYEDEVYLERRERAAEKIRKADGHANIHEDFRTFGGKRRSNKKTLKKSRKIKRKL